VSTLLERIAQDLTAAMKARDAVRTGVLRMAKAALKDREIEKRAPVDEQEALRVLRGLVKQREDAVEHFERAGRAELVAKEQAEIAFLSGYLPREATDEQIRAAVERAVSETAASTLKDIGKVMKAAFAALDEGGTPADGKRVNELVRKRLGG
jgi:uncharacterized protein YqeY